MLPVYCNCPWCWMTDCLLTRCYRQLLLKHSLWLRAAPSKCLGKLLFDDIAHSFASLIFDPHCWLLCWDEHPVKTHPWHLGTYLGWRGRREPERAHTPPGTTVTQPCWAGRVRTSHQQPRLGEPGGGRRGNVRLRVRSFGLSLCADLCVCVGWSATHTANKWVRKTQQGGKRTA